MNDKIRCIREKMKLLNLQGLIVSNPVNIRYILGIGVEGVILLTDKENIFITDARYIEEVNEFLTINDDFVIYDAKDLSDIDNYSFFQDCENVGFEENYVTFSNYENMIRKYRIKNFEETDKIVEKIRMIKDDKEIKDIEKACKITDKCFNHLINYIKIGMTEKEVAFEIEKFFIENGVDGLAFETIVASGENSSKPHAIPTDKMIRYKDPITIDFGAKVNGYSSDMTRTIFAGNIQDEVKELYNLVLKVQQKSIKWMKEGIACKTIARDAENELYIYNYSLIHALGHGVGLEVHELPIISHNSKFSLKENMVVTSEPGIYIPGKYGIRIEDTLKIGRLEPEILTKSSKEIIIVDKR
jgi:Xaa-Pro aminopeptidase